MAGSDGLSSAVVASRGASYLTVQTVVTSLAQVLSFAVLARIITPSEVGILAILSLITVLSQSVNGAAFQQAAMKYVGEFADTERSFAVGVFFQTLRTSVAVSVPFAVFILLGSGFLAKIMLGTASQAGLFQVLSADVMVYAGALPVAMGVVLGAKRFKVSAAIGTAGAVMRQVLIIALILFLKSFIGLVYAWVLSDFAMLALFGFYAVRMLGLTKSTFPLRQLLIFSWPLSAGNLVSFAYSWFDRAVLIALAPLASLGVYNAALYAFGAMSSISTAFGNVLLPVYSSVSVGGLEGSRRATRLASRYVSLIMVPLAFGLFGTARPALTLFVGEKYVNGVLPLMVLSLVFGLTAFGLVLGPMLTALAKTRAVMWITAASAVVGLGSAYLLLPFLGIVGASVARGVAMVASLALTVIVLKRMNAFSLDLEMAWKSLVAGGVMGVMLIAVQSVAYSRLLLPAYMLLGAGVYVVLLRVLRAVEAHDVEIIRGYLGVHLRFLAALLGAILISQAVNPVGTNTFGKPADQSAVPETVDPNSPPDQISVSRKEWDALLSDNQQLLNRAERLVKRVDDLENEKSRLRDELAVVNTQPTHDKAGLSETKEHTNLALKRAQGILERLIEETDKRITGRAART